MKVGVTATGSDRSLGVFDDPSLLQAAVVLSPSCDSNNGRRLTALVLLAGNDRTDARGREDLRPTAKEALCGRLMGKAGGGVKRCIDVKAREEESEAREEESEARLCSSLCSNLQRFSGRLAIFV